MEKRQSKKRKLVKKKIFGNKKNNSVATPKSIYDFIERVFGFKKEDFYDPCPLNNVKFNSLLKESEWGEINFVNPPFNSSKGKRNGIKFFIQKALQEKGKGKTSVFLIRCSTSTNYFRDIIMQCYDSIIFLPQNVIFEGYQSYFPFPLCIVLFRGGKTRKERGNVKQTSPDFLGKKAIQFSYDENLEEKSFIYNYEKNID